MRSNKYCKMLSKVKSSESYKQNLLVLLQEKKAKPKLKYFPKIVLAAAVVLIAATFSVTVLAEGPLKDTWVAKIVFGSGSSEIIIKNDNAGIPISSNASKEAVTGLTLSQISNMLNVKFLSSDLFADSTVRYNPVIPKTREGKLLGKDIESVEIWYADCVDYSNQRDNVEDKFISCSMMFLTDKATTRVEMPEGYDAAGGKEFFEKYTITSLDTPAYLYGVDWDEKRLTAAFVYKNIYYEFIGNNVSPDELKVLLDSLKD